ncbi:hypothetical protein MPNTM1_01295 [Mycolicibacterium parafortuitum]
MGAALLGFSLLSPELGVAAADSGSESAAASDSSGPAKPRRSTDTTEATEAGEKADQARESDDDAAQTGVRRAEDKPDTTGEFDTTGEDADLDEVGDDATAEAIVRGKPAATAATVTVDPDVEDDTEQVESSSAAAESPALVPATAAAPPQPPYISEQSEYQKWVATVLDEWTERNQEWVDSLQVSEEKKQRLQASFLAMRRTLFNQAPTVAPIQIAGVISGPVVGSLGGVDPDGDRLIYVMTRAPKTGTVKFHADGTYTYTPGEDFSGVDTFHIAAVDIGLHLNLLQPFRPVASGLATSLINQGAVTFDFAYTSGSDHWDDDKKAALQRAAEKLIQHFRVVKPVVLTYDVTGFYDPSVGTLANAYGLLISDQDGFWPSRIMHEIITGEDSNGAEADGYINVNFAKPFAFGDEVPGDQFDFTTTIMHELIHSFGFALGSGVNRRWHYFGKFMVNDEAKSLFNGDYTINTQYEGNITGANNGLFFGGAHAVAANNGQLVRIYTPNPLEPGSSLTHLDLQTFRHLMMSPELAFGPGVRTLSVLELAIMRDLGYTVVPVTTLRS